MSRGVFITFEGPEGSGKSTHIRTLAERLRAAGRDVVTTREPGGTRLGEAIRGLLQHDTAADAPVPRAETLLFCASRAQIVDQVIAPALARGAWVLCDRFSDSTLAYQGFGRGCPLDELARLSRFACDGLTPDLTLLLDLPVAAGARRIANRHRRQAGVPDRFEREETAFHARLRDGFLVLAAREPQRFRVIDSDRPLALVAASVWSSVSARFALDGAGPAGEAPDAP